MEGNVLLRIVWVERPFRADLRDSFKGPALCGLGCEARAVLLPLLTDLSLFFIT